MATVQTTLGPVSGFEDTHVLSEKSTAGQAKGDQRPVIKYLGIPYGVGGRWEQARPPTPWKSTKECIEYGPATPQLPGIIGQRISAQEGFLKRLHLGMSEENIFTINIYASEGVKEGDNVPVMFWTYGGSWKDGTAGAMLYDASNVIRASPQPIIIVSVNYRTNFFGFLASEDLKDEDGLVGNYGLRDQLLGLKFVSDNISKFGGDRDNITIYGESAGAASVVYHCVGRDAIFKRAIAQSGGSATMSYQKLEAHEAVWQLVLKEFNITADDKVERVKQARAIPTNDLLALLHKNPGISFAACQEDGPNAIWNEHPSAKFARGQVVPSLESYMAGVCTDEGLVFAHLFGLIGNQTTTNMFVGRHGTEAAAQYPEIYSNIGDVSQYKGALESHPAARMLHNELFEGPVMFDLEQLAKTGKVTCFMYRSNAILPYWRAFDWGVHHASELPFVFNSSALWGNDDNTEEGRTAQDYVDKWVSFAATGQPAAKSVWPQYTSQERKRYVFENGGSEKAHLEAADLTPAMQMHDKIIRDSAGIKLVAS
ncbi:Carboxylesterase [Protomyces lactucae-debilis]|uniref:Carboxylic ester hydrolase n=1 Tax=Protomyces lactucae-debilis TaxID=2754530 RepID=A0A1Y2F5P3_PROLT|nr:Carboxylesterase [Protomyces lactucae-debilis]ORY78666.1 Carboxylesterase [Protomyces lactucae-debilis]